MGLLARTYVWLDGCSDDCDCCALGCMRSMVWAVSGLDVVLDGLAMDG